MRRAQHSSHPVGENPNSGKPKVRSNLYLADFEGGPLSTVTILSSIETSTSTVDIRRSENLLSTNYLSSFLLSATHRLVRRNAEKREGGPGMATYLCRLTGMMVTARVADFGLGPSVPPTGPSKLRLQAGKFWRFWGAETPISQKRRP